MNILALAPGQKGGITNPALGPSLQTKSGIQFFGELLPRMVGLGFLVGVLIFFFVMIAGAIGWITSGGDKAAIESARGRITSAIIGLLILFALFALIGAIENFFGINILSLDIGPFAIK